jgi:hypothetical protein
MTLALVKRAIMLGVATLDESPSWTASRKPWSKGASRYLSANAGQESLFSMLANHPNINKVDARSRNHLSHVSRSQAPSLGSDGRTYGYL